MKKLFLILLLLLLPLNSFGVEDFQIHTQNAISSLTVPSGGASITGGLTINPTLATTILTWSEANWDEDDATWTMTTTGPLVHVTGNVTAITATLTEAVTVGAVYKIVITGTGGVATATYTFGGVTGTTIPTGAIAITDYITATANATMVITPANTCTASITSITIQKVTNAGLSLYNSLNLYGGQFLGNKGTAVYPTYSYIEDPLVGFYYINAYEIGLSLAGTRRYSFSSSQLLMDTANVIQFSSNIALSAKSAGVLALSGTSQEFRVYALDTDAANYEYASLKATAGAVTLSAGTLGTGTDNIDIVLTPAGTGGVKQAGTTGGLLRKVAEASVDVTAAATITIAVNVPTSARILGCQIRVDHALAATETWNAAYATGNAQTIGHEEPVAANTKINVPFEGLDTAGTLAAQAAWASDITTATTIIQIKKHSNPGVDVFTAQGTFTAIVYYESFDAMANH